MPRTTTATGCFALAVLAAACATSAAPHSPCPAAAPAPATLPTSPNAPLARETTITGRRLRYHLTLSLQPNVVYQLDCVAGVALCAEPVFRELWKARHLDTDASGALTTWKTVRARRAGDIKRTDEEGAPLALLVPSRVADLTERQRIAGLRAVTLDEYEASMALLTSDADASALRSVVERVAPRLQGWWQSEGFPAGSAYLDGFARLLADPFFDETVDAAARFYEADLGSGAEIRIALLVQPASHRDFTVAYQLEGDAVVEVPPHGRPEAQIDVVAHELFHYLFFLQRSDRRAALVARVAGSSDRYAAASFGMLDEAVAAALGNGVVGAHYVPAADFAAQLAKGFVNYEAAGALARALYPSLSNILADGATVSSEEFARVFEGAARDSYAGGKPRPIDYLHSEISIAPHALQGAAQHLHEIAWAGFPYLRDHLPDDPAAATDLAAHPLESAAIFLPADGTLAGRLAALGTPPKHAAAIAARARSSPAFVYAYARGAKAYAFVLVARDDAAATRLVDRFAALVAPLAEGVEVEAE